MLPKTLILLVLGIAVATLHAAPAKKNGRPAVSPLCVAPTSPCVYRPEDTCFEDSNCRSTSTYTGLCCPHACRPYKMCQWVEKPEPTTMRPTPLPTEEVNTEEGSGRITNAPTPRRTTQESTTTETPTTKRTTTTKKPTTQKPTTEEITTKEPSTTAAPITTTSAPVTTTQTPTTTQEPTTQKPTTEEITTKEPSTTAAATTTTSAPVTTTQTPTTTQEPTTQQPTTEEITTKKPSTTAAPTTTTSAPVTTTQTLTTTQEPTTTKVPTTTLPPTTSPAPTTKQAPPTTEPVPDNVCRSTETKNILFIVDGTAHPMQYPHIVKQEFDMLKTHLKNVMLRLENENFMIGVMQFGGKYDPKMEVQFTSGTDMSWLLSRVDAIRQVKGSERQTGEALEVASNEFYKMKYLNDRYDSQDIIVLVTRGYDHNVPKTKREVEMLRKKSIKIISIGTGSSRPNYLEKQLYYLSSSIKDVYIAKYKMLAAIEDGVVNSICATFAKPGRRSICGLQQSDIYIVLDGSASIDYSNFDKKRDFLIDLLYILETPKSELHMGMMQFSEISKTEELLKLGKHTIEEEERLIRGIQYSNGRKTMLGYALNLFNDTVFNGEVGDRADAPNILVIFSDGRAHDLHEALRVAESIKRKGVRIITLTVLRNAMTGALVQMASEPKYSVNVDLRDPTYYAQKLAALICPDHKKKL